MRAIVWWCWPKSSTSKEALMALHTPPLPPSSDYGMLEWWYAPGTCVRTRTLGGGGASCNAACADRPVLSNLSLAHPGQQGLGCKSTDEARLAHVGVLHCPSQAFSAVRLASAMSQGPLLGHTEVSFIWPRLGPRPNTVVQTPPPRSRSPHVRADWCPPFHVCTETTQIEDDNLGTLQF
ncbi:hypothetical protein GQ53DRAFT_513775 [Thozetella sp. PMI_491]|nr:hypothetical protein GQ53DRAFT_513775 [Thozetella sp. PMI_491]